eukprot:4086326-Pyramimonas_sp.AAC.1
MASKMVQDGLQVRPRWSTTASKTAQESPRYLQGRPRSLGPARAHHEASPDPRGRQDGARRPQEASKTAHEGPETPH